MKNHKDHTRKVWPDMFIDNGSLVTVKETAQRQDLRGRFGVVSRIRIIAETAAVLVFVELFDHETGASPVFMFDPADLEKRKNVATKKPLNRPKATDELHKIRLLELAA